MPTVQTPAWLPKLSTTLPRPQLVFGAGASLLQASIYTVDGGHRAVMFNRLSGIQVRAA